MKATNQIPTKAQLLAIPEIGHEVRLAEMLGITRSAVNQWPDKKSVPERRWLFLRYQARPDLFENQAA